MSILSLSHVSHLMTHRAWRHDQPVLKVLCEKALGNEHCAKVPVKRELRSSGYRKVGMEA